MRRSVIVVLAVTHALALSAAEPAPPNGASAGGTLRVLYSGPDPTLDPAVAAAPTGWGALWYATCATLMAFRDAAAPAGQTVRPEAAAGVPALSRDRRTYVFTIRDGLRFSDGSPLRARNFARALARTLNPVMRSEGASSFSDVKRVSASGRRLLIELKRPSGSLLTRLALPYACPVPLGFPVDPAGVRLMAGSGPYYVADYEPGRLLVLERNRYYLGTRPRLMGRVVVTIGGDIESNADAVADGRAEVLGQELPGELRVDLARRYGVNERQFFQIRGTSITALVLNAARPLFKKNPALRKAVNLALDRSTIVRSANGWPVSPVLTDQLLTRWMPGWTDHRLYSLARPDLGLARRLSAGNRRGGMAVLWTSPSRNARDQAATIVRNLGEIGLAVDVKVMASEVVEALASTPGAQYDMLLGTMALDYPDPANVIIRLLAGGNARKPADNSNYAYFDLPAYNRRMAAADRLTGSARARAFSQLEADLMRNQAPWAPLFEGASSLFVSARVGCLARHPVFRMDVGAMCLR